MISAAGCEVRRILVPRRRSETHTQDFRLSSSLDSDSTLVRREGGVIEPVRRLPNCSDSGAASIEPYQLLRNRIAINQRPIGCDGWIGGVAGDSKSFSLKPDVFQRKTIEPTDRFRTGTANARWGNKTLDYEPDR